MKKGITATSVAIMALIIIIIIGTITTLSYNSIENAEKITFSLEISNLQELVDKYSRDNTLDIYSILENEYLIKLTGISSRSISQFDGEPQNDNNEIVVYELDLSALGITDTVYGNKKTEKDVYVMSKTTGRVYYIEGIKANGITYYTLTDELLGIKAKNITQDEQVTSKKPVISTGGFVTKVLSNGSEEVYLSNIKVDSTPKIFKYEIGIIPEETASQYFERYGKSIVGDMIKLEKKVDVTLYAQNTDGVYTVLYCNTD